MCIRDRGSSELVRACASMRPGAGSSPETLAKVALRSLARRARMLDEEDVYKRQADTSGLAYRQSESIPAGRSSKAGMFRRNAAAKGAQKPMLPASEKPAEFLFRTPWFRALLYIT